MATCRQIITDAWHDSGILDIEADPSAIQANTGLRVLQGLYSYLVSSGALGRFRGRLITGDYTAGENERIAYEGNTTANVTLPTTIPVPAIFERDRIDGGDFDTGFTGLTVPASVDRNNRQPNDLATAEVVGSSGQLYIYDASVGDWILLTGLTLDSTAPLSSRFQSGLTAMLTTRLCARSTTPVSQGIAAEAALAKIAIIGAFSGKRLVTVTQYF